ncbi:hypothetical protein BJ165DRAFT_605336 [Panaeolus papilionaceus]|nr:hypothetical protein BJ165DRAFT_605336 [Panaeolus papilionaceus]
MPSTARRSNSKQYLAKLKLNCTACTHRLLPRGWMDSGCGYAIFVLDSNTQVLKEHSSGKIHTTHGLVLGFGRCSQAAGIWIGMSTVLPSLRNFNESGAIKCCASVTLSGVEGCRSMRTPMPSVFHREHESLPSITYKRAVIDLVEREVVAASTINILVPMLSVENTHESVN